MLTWNLVGLGVQISTAHFACLERTMCRSLRISFKADLVVWNCTLFCRSWCALSICACHSRFTGCRDDRLTRLCFVSALPVAAWFNVLSWHSPKDRGEIQDNHYHEPGLNKVEFKPSRKLSWTARFTVVIRLLNDIVSA